MLDSKTGSSLFLFGPLTDLLASVQYSSPVWSGDDTNYPVYSRVSWQFKVDNVFENTFETVICWSSMCGWLAVCFRDLLQWRQWIGDVCVCPSGFTGEQCHYLVNICQDWGSRDEIRCQCTSLYSGPRCENMVESTEIGKWDPVPSPPQHQVQQSTLNTYSCPTMVQAEFGFFWAYFFKLVLWKLKTLKKNTSTSYILEQNTNLAENFIIKYALKK
jgi:hypothetical protein